MATPTTWLAKETSSDWPFLWTFMQPALGATTSHLVPTAEVYVLLLFVGLVYRLANLIVKPKEYEHILKSFLGRDSYFRYGPNNFPFITSELNFMYNRPRLTILRLQHRQSN
jgi:hypothetical protein